MGKTLGVVLAVIVVALGIIGATSLFTVDEREQAMIMRFGKVDKIITEPGLQFKIPFVQNVIFVERRVLAVNASRSEVVTKDQKRLLVDAFSRFRISDPLLYYQSFGDLRVASSRIETLLS